METFYNLLLKEKEILETEIVEYFKNYTNIRYDKLNKYGGGIIILGSDYTWDDLSEDGKRKQTELYNKYKKITEFLRVVILTLPDRESKLLNERFGSVENFILQNSRPYEKSTEEVIERVLKEVNEQFQLLELIDFRKENDTIFVPDTNALLINPNVENWQFDSIDTFEILLLPTVLSELDSLKIVHNNKELREKANKIIKKIKEYRRRGKLNDGIVVTKKIKLSTLSIEPKFNNTLDWLDPENNDDRIVASFIEVCRINIRNKVTLVTSDINLQNKLEFINLPFVEPPEID
ncbi:MAG: hypothetical protein KQH79_11465 [Bacteroidetes bacterium]|nr:hypothetical protein [Bacteroidota bacterium]